MGLLRLYHIEHVCLSELLVSAGQLTFVSCPYQQTLVNFEIFRELFL